MRIEVAQVVTQIIAFLVMLWVMKRYAWKPILALLEARRQKIAEEFEAIGKAKQEIEWLTEEHKQKMRDIDGYALSKTKEGIARGKQLAQEIQDEAHAEAKEIILKAKADQENEILKAKAELKKKLVEITVAASEKIIKANLDSAKQEHLIADFIEEVGSK